jgi:CRP-like cAMP-binding protein
MARADTTTFADADLLKAIALFERLPPEVTSCVMRGHRYRSVQAGEVVVARGERVPYFKCILSGAVKLQLRGGRQKKRILAIVGPGQCFCMASVFLELPCPVTAVVLEPGRLLSLKREAVIEAATLHAPLSLRLLGRLSLLLYEGIRTLEMDAASSAAERVVRWLLSHEFFASEGGAVVLEVSKKTVAASLNVTPETFSRVLGRLQKAGLIDVGRREIRVLDLAGLKAARSRVFGGSAQGLPDLSGAPLAGGDEIDAVHWLEEIGSTGDVPHWFSADPGDSA